MGGAQTFLLNLLSRWPDERDEIHVAALGSRSELLEAFRELKRIRTHASGGGNPSAGNMARALLCLSGGGFDIIHCHLSRSGVFALLCPLPPRAGLILHEHGDPTLRHFYYHFAIRARQRRVDRVFANAPDVAQQFGRCVRFPSERIAVVPNGICVDRFESCASRREEFRDELGIASEAPVIGFVGRLAKQKGASYLIEALGFVHRERPDAIALIVGDGPLRPTLEAQAATLGLSGSVRFVGYQIDTPKWLSAFDVGVIPSLWEPFGIVAIEMMAAGIPVVAANLGGLRDNIRNGITGFLVPSENAQAIAESVLRLISDDRLGRELAEEAHAYVAEHFAIEKVALRIRTLYDGIAEGRRSF